MSWRIVKLGSVITHRKEFITISDSEEYKRCRVQVNRKGVVLRDVVKGSAINTKKQQVCKAGDFLVAEIDAKVGGYGFVPAQLEGAIVSSHYFLFDVDETKMLKSYLAWLIRTDIIQEQINSKGSTNYAAIRPKNVLDFEIPLPSTIQQQEEIVDRLDSFSVNYLEVLKELDQQQSYLQLLHQTILQEAVQGKLTKQDEADEPASELLKRIKAEKQKLVKEGKLKKEKELPPISEAEIPFELPKGWVWCRLGEIALFSEAGKSYQCEERQVEGDEWGIIKMSAVSSGVFKESENKFFKSSLNKEQAYKIENGDMLFARASGSKELTGVSCVIQSIRANLLLNDKTIRFRFPKYLSVEYINSWNNCFLGRAYYETIMGSKTTTMNNITREQFNCLPVPLPPQLEQQRIITKVQQLQQQLSSLEVQVQQSQQYAQLLLQTVLKEAFEAKEKQYEMNEELSLAAEN